MIKTSDPVVQRNSTFSLFSAVLSAVCICAIATVANGASLPPVEEGLASVYSREFNGKITASGERYDGNIYTAAHRTLPFGTVVKVTNLDNGKSVRVRINDRGPHVRGRIIDLSSSAATALAMTTGVARARIEVVSEARGVRGPQVDRERAVGTGDRAMILDAIGIVRASGEGMIRLDPENLQAPHGKSPNQPGPS